jgi:orotidine-5'-phosphate decarboxylase
LKTHIDLIGDFGPEIAEGIKRLAKKHDFLVFEDRKFGETPFANNTAPEDSKLSTGQISSMLILSREKVLLKV